MTPELSEALERRSIPPNAICVFLDGDKWCAVYGNYRNLQESPAAFGDTMAQAMESLCRGVQPQRDERPITEEWLREIGFKERDGWPLGVWMENVRWLRHRDGTAWVTFGEHPLITKQPITRSQLLSLLGALNVEVKHA